MKNGENGINRENENNKNTDIQKAMRDLLCKVIPRPLLSFDVEVTEHCNLNCRSCGSMAPLAEEEYIDLEDYERDIARLSYLTGGEVSFINLLGGEPLLHPEIVKIMSLTRSYFGYGNINLVTNGVLLPKMGTQFWECCRENDIVVAPTKYPISLDYDLVEETARNFGVRYEYFGKIPAHSVWNHYAITEKGDRWPVHQFLKCTNANFCTVLKDGKLYPCPRIPKIKHFNRAFKKNFQVSRRDYIDIYDETIKLEDIMNFLTKPVPFCRYCNVFATYEQDWGVSEGRIEEWT